MNFKPIIKEMLIPQGQYNTIFSDTMVRIIVHDEAGGPFLGIEGVYDPEGNDEYSTHEFFLNDEDEIDQFCQICKEVLRQAVNAEKTDNKLEQGETE